MAKSKKLTLDYLAKDGKSYDKLKKITLGNDMYIEIYEKFSNQRIDEMLVDCSKFIDQYNQSNKLDDKKTIDYVNLFILKWFSTVVDRKTYSFEETVVLFDNILKSGYSEEIFEQFNQAEVQKVYDRMFKKLDTLQKVLSERKDIREQIKDNIMNSNLQNKDEIYDMFFNESQNEVTSDANV